MASTTTKTLHDAVSEAYGQGAHGPDSLGSIVLSGGLTDHVNSVLSSRWDCKYRLGAVESQDFNEWVGGNYVNHVGTAVASTHATVRAAQSYCIDVVIRRLKGNCGSVLVLWSTYQEARYIFEQLPEIDCRFTLGKSHPKDGIRLSKGLATANVDNLAGDPFAQDFLNVVTTGCVGRYFCIVDTLEDCPRFNVDVCLAFDCLYEIDPRAFGVFLSERGINRSLFTMHTAGELAHVPKVVNPIFPYVWRRCEDRCEMVFNDCSQPYVHSWKALQKWWLHGCVAFTTGNLVWETAFHNYGYGIFEGYLERAEGLHVQKRFYASQGKVMFFPRVRNILESGQIVPVPVMAAKYEAARQYVLSVMDGTDVQKIMQNLRAQTHRIVVGNRTLSVAWNMLDQDVVEILQFVILHTSLERLDLHDIMREIGKCIAGSRGFEANFYSLWVQLARFSTEVYNWLEKVGLKPARVLFVIRQFLDDPNPPMVSYLVGAPKLPKRPQLTFDPLLAVRWAGVAVGGDLVDTADQFVQYQREVLNYERSSPANGNHGSAKLEDLVQFDQSTVVHHFGVEPGGMLAALAQMGYAGYAYTLKGDDEGLRSMNPSLDIFKRFVFKELKAIDLTEKAICEIPEGPSAFIFDCAHCAGCTIEEQLPFDCMAVIAEHIPHYFVLKVLFANIVRFERLLSLVPKIYSLQVVKPRRASPMSYEVYLVGTPCIYRVTSLIPWYNPLVWTYMKHLNVVFTNWVTYAEWLHIQPECDPKPVVIVPSVEAPIVPRDALAPSVVAPQVLNADGEILMEMEDEEPLVRAERVPELEQLMAEATRLRENLAVPPLPIGLVGLSTEQIQGIVEARGAVRRAQEADLEDNIAEIQEWLNDHPEEGGVLPELEIPDEPEEEVEIVHEESLEFVQRKAVKDAWEPSLVNLYFVEIDMDGFCFYKAISVLRGGFQEDYRGVMVELAKFLLIDPAILEHGWPDMKDISRFCIAKRITFHSQELNGGGVIASRIFANKLVFGTLVLTHTGGRGHADVALTNDHPYIRRPSVITNEDLIWHTLDLYKDDKEPARTFKRDCEYFSNAMCKMDDPDMAKAHGVVSTRLKTLRYVRQQAKFAFIHGKAGTGKSAFPVAMMRPSIDLYITATNVNKCETMRDTFKKQKVPRAKQDLYGFKTLYHAFTIGNRLPNPAIKRVYVDECLRSPWNLMTVYAQAFPAAEFVFMGDPQQMGISHLWFPDMNGFKAIPDAFSEQQISLMDPNQVTLRDVSWRFGPKACSIIRYYCPKVIIFSATAKQYLFLKVKRGQPMPIVPAHDFLALYNEGSTKFSLPENTEASISIAASQGATRKVVHIYVNKVTIGNWKSWRDTMYVGLSRASDETVLVEMEEGALDTLNSISTAPEAKQRMPYKVIKGGRPPKSVRKTRFGGLFAESKKAVVSLPGSIERYATFERRLTKTKTFTVPGLDTAFIKEAFRSRPFSYAKTEHVYEKLVRYPRLTNQKFSLGELNQWNVDNPEAIVNNVECMSFQAPELMECVIAGQNLHGRSFLVSKPVGAQAGKRHYTKSVIQSLNTFMERIADTQAARTLQARSSLQKEMQSIPFLQRMRKDFFDTYIDPEKYESMLREDVAEHLLAETWNEFARVVKFTSPQANMTMAGFQGIVTGHLKSQIRSKGLEATYKEKGGQPVVASEKIANIAFSGAVRFVKAMLSRCMKAEWLWADGCSAAAISEFAERFVETFAWMGDSEKFDATHTRNTRPCVEFVWALFTDDRDTLTFMVATKDGRKVYVTNVMNYVTTGGQDSGGSDTMTINITFSMIIVILLMPRKYMLGGMFNGDDWVVYSNFYVIPFELKYYCSWFKNPIKILIHGTVAEFCNFLFGSKHHCYNPLVLAMKIMNKNNVGVLSSRESWIEWRQGVRDLTMPFRYDFQKSAQITAEWSGLTIESAQGLIWALDSYSDMSFSEAKATLGREEIFEDFVVGGSLINTNFSSMIKSFYPYKETITQLNYVHVDSIVNGLDKNKLQELLAAKDLALPQYTTVLTGGSAHCPEFACTVALGPQCNKGLPLLRVSGAPSKVTAEKFAAHHVMKELLGVQREISPAAQHAQGLPNVFPTFKKVLVSEREVRNAADYLSTLQQLMESSGNYEYLSALSETHNALMHALNGNGTLMHSGLIPRQVGVFQFKNATWVKAPARRGGFAMGDSWKQSGQFKAGKRYFTNEAKGLVAIVDSVNPSCIVIVVHGRKRVLEEQPESEDSASSSDSDEFVTIDPEAPVLEFCGVCRTGFEVGDYEKHFK